MIKVSKKIVIIALVFIVISLIVSQVFALEDTSIFEPDTANGRGLGRIVEIVNLILGIITVFGVIVGVGGFMIIGIQTIYASAEEKAVYKQKMLPFLIGLILLFLSVGIVSFISKWANN